jgi:hypothetical protein
MNQKNQSLKILFLAFDNLFNYKIIHHNRILDLNSEDIFSLL